MKTWFSAGKKAAAILLLLLAGLAIASFESDGKTKSTAERLKIPILMYHEFTTDPAQWDYATVSPEKFYNDLRTLKDNGFTPIFFKDIDLARQGKVKLPGKSVLITIDDGYYSTYEFAYPILKQMNMKATISIIGWSVGREYHNDGITPITRHFTWEQGKEMYESGLVDIQSHSFNLHNQSDGEHGVAPYTRETQEAYIERFKRDTLRIKELIEKRIGNEVVVYTYPYGVHNHMSETILRELGFKYSLTVDDGVSDFNANPYLLKRINVPFDLSSMELIKKIERENQ
ncbi:hypothetical protein GCM10020370_55460 [Paenibacillus hodogayensis]